MPFSAFLHRAAAVAATCLPFALPPLPAAALDVTTEDNPPFNYLDAGQRITGMTTEIVVEMARRANVPLKLQLTPWARAYSLAMSVPDTCVYSAARLPEREALFKWIGPITVNKWALFARGDFEGKLETIDDARRYRIGGVNMDAKVTYLKSLGFTQVESVNEDALNVAKLLAGRIDLLIAGYYKGKELAALSGARTLHPVLVVREVDYYLACNPKTSDATVAALSRELQALHKEGFVRAVTERYATRMH